MDLSIMSNWWQEMLIEVRKNIQGKPVCTWYCYHINGARSCLYYDGSYCYETNPNLTPRNPTLDHWMSLKNEKTF